MCGKAISASEMYQAIVEGTMLKVCQSCCKYGKVTKLPEPPVLKEKGRGALQPRMLEEIEEMVTEGYAEIIKAAREAKNLKQEDLAKNINEKESLLHRIETGHMEPNIPLARKLEHALGIKLVEQVKLQGGVSTGIKKSPSNLTLGDVITIKRRNK